jgi:hypothetical protein
MMEYGHNLVKQIPYYSPTNGHIYYKSDAQTAMGSRATGLYPIDKEIKQCSNLNYSHS